MVIVQVKCGGQHQKNRGRLCLHVLKLETLCKLVSFFLLESNEIVGQYAINIFFLWTWRTPIEPSCV